MRIAGVEPSMGCLKDNCFTIKQYSLFTLLFIILFIQKVLINK